MVYIDWSEHAQKQLQERRLAEKAVIQAINSPDKLIRQADLRYRTVKFVKRAKKQYLLISL